MKVIETVKQNQPYCPPEREKAGCGSGKEKYSSRLYFNTGIFTARTKPPVSPRQNFI